MGARSRLGSANGQKYQAEKRRAHEPYGIEEARHSGVLPEAKVAMEESVLFASFRYVVRVVKVRMLHRQGVSDASMCYAVYSDRDRVDRKRDW